MRKINIQKDVVSREKIGMSLPVITPFDTMEESKTAEHSNETVIETEDAQSEVIHRPEADQIPDQQDIPKKGGRKTKGNV